jgi:hypothetical protein
VPPDLVGRRLDVAERMLRRTGIAYSVIRLHSHAVGSTSQWGVCETMPAGASTEGAPGIELLVVHAKCGAS